MKKIILLLLLQALFNVHLYATHNAGAEITYEHISGDTYKVRLNYISDCGGISPPSSAYIYAFVESNSTINTSAFLPMVVFGEEISGYCDSQLGNTTCNGGFNPGYNKYVFEGQITLPSKHTDWIISYEECCRNTQIQNLVNPDMENMYVEARLNNTGTIYNNSPKFLMNPITTICSGQLVSYNMGAYDIDKDSLVYSLVAAKTSAGVNIGYNAPATAQNPIVGTYSSFNSENGTFTINADGSDPVAVIVIKVEEYRAGTLIGSSERDMQVLVQACSNDLPAVTGSGIYNLNGATLTDSSSIECTTGNTVSFDLQFADVNALDSLSLISGFDSILPNAVVTITGQNPLTASVDWVVQSNQIGLHTIVFNVRDNACPVYGELFYPINIKVNATNIHYIHGRNYIDANTSCAYDVSESTLPLIIKTNNGSVYMSDSGYYSFPLQTNVNYLVEPIIPTNKLWLINAVCPSSYNVYLDSTTATDTFGFDFGFDMIACPMLTVDVSSNRRRRCFRNYTSVQYCNEGFADQDSVAVTVQLPEYVHFISADSSYSVDSEGNYVFEIGTLAQGACGSIQIIDSVACINNITGLTQCTKAWITPTNDCIRDLDTTKGENAGWDKSSVKVTGSCLGDSIVQFIIENTGNFGGGDMADSSEYRIYLNDTLAYTANFKLTGGETLVVEVIANGQTLRLEADQRPFHPGNSRPRETIEDCGNSGTPIVFGNATNTTSDDADLEIEEHCLTIVDSYDPNDKQVQPQGITDQHYVPSNSMLDYQIRFQNTGSDTAYKVVIVDTLDANLDLSTLQLGSSSHKYLTEITGEGIAVVTFTFDEINLPDSATDELNSQGYIKFKIAPYGNLPAKTIVSNSAQIYFDFNSPIVTNDAWVSVFDTTLTGGEIEFNVLMNMDEQIDLENLKAYPNPFYDLLTIGLNQIPVTNEVQLKVYDLLGRAQEVPFEIRNKHIVVNGAHLDNGVYLLDIQQGNQHYRSKIIKQ